MTIAKIKQKPIRLAPNKKRGVRTQFGALCYRVNNDKVQVLMITSRGRGRWILPKGWPMDGATPSDAAATEAYEEAGAVGKTKDICLGIYSYLKGTGGGEKLPCVVAVFPIKVKSLLEDYPEQGQRKRKWFGLKKAASLVAEPELAQIIRRFDPAKL